MPPQTRASKKRGPPEPTEEEKKAKHFLAALTDAVDKMSSDREESYQTMLEQYRLAVIHKYFHTTSRGRQLTCRQFSELSLTAFNDMKFWVEPGYVCTDFKLSPAKELETIRHYVTVKNNSEEINELVYQHGTVYLHAAVIPWTNLMPEQATLWLVSIVDEETKTTVWPATWINADDFDGLVFHSSTPRSEHWRNSTPFTLNMVPEFLLKQKRPLVRMAGMVEVKENLPFNYYLDCEIRTKQGFVRKLLSRSELVDCFSACTIQLSKSKFAVDTYHPVLWREIQVYFPKIESPPVDLMLEPHFWAETVINHRSVVRGEESEFDYKSHLKGDINAVAKQKQQWLNLIAERDSFLPTDKDIEEFH
jgi:hypothetical protein